MPAIESSKGEDKFDHHLWVVSYADMVTLLFAVFVVFYSMSEVHRKHLAELKRSLTIAFNSGEGEYDTKGMFDRGTGKGEILDGFELVNSQPGEMRELLLKTLPDTFEEVTGKSLEINITDSTIKMTASLSAFFEPRRDQPRRQVGEWFLRLMRKTNRIVADTEIVIRAPDTIVDTLPNGIHVGPRRICSDRAVALTEVASVIRGFDRTALRTTVEIGESQGGAWEDEATVTISFLSR